MTTPQYHHLVVKLDHSGNSKSYWTNLLRWGIAFGFANTAGVGAIASYFNRHLFKASCVGLIGTGIGAIIYGSLVEWFIEMYGWRGASLLLAGISLQGCIVASIVFPVPQSFPPKESHPMKQTTSDSNCHQCHQASITAEVQQSDLVAEDGSEDDCNDAMIKQPSRSTVSSRMEFQSDTRNSDKAITVHRLFRDFRFWSLSYVAFTWGFCVLIFINIQKDVIISAGLVEYFQLAVGTSGIANTAARVLLCFLTFDNIFLSYVFVLLLGGIIVSVYAVVANYWTLVVLSLFSGLFFGASFVMLPLSIGAIYGRQKMALTYGYVVFSVGLASVCGPSLTGYLRDVTGFYNASLYLIGAVQVTGAIVAGFLYFWMKSTSNVK